MDAKLQINPAHVLAKKLTAQAPAFARASAGITCDIINFPQ
jgi:hypothetical protein